MKLRIYFYFIQLLISSVLLLSGCTLETETSLPPPIPQGSDLVINEVYTISPDKHYTYAWFELYNPTNRPIPLLSFVRDEEAEMDTSMAIVLLSLAERHYLAEGSDDFVTRIDTGIVTIFFEGGLMSPGKFLVATNNKNRFESHFRLGPFNPIFVEFQKFPFVELDPRTGVLLFSSYYKWYPLSSGEIILLRSISRKWGVLAYSDGTPWKVDSLWLANGAAPVGALAVDGGKVYAGMLGAGVLRSDDNGGTWANTGLTDQVVLSLFVHGSDIYAGTKEGVFKSSDEGNSWTQINAGLPQRTFVRSIASSDTTLFIGTNRGVYHSTNKGISWMSGDTGFAPKDVRSVAVVGNVLFAGTLGDSVFLSTDQGVSWRGANRGLTAANIFALFADTTRLFAGTDRGVFLSSDTGKTWNAVNVGLIQAGVTPRVFSFTRSGSRIYAGTINRGIFSTRNNGGVWDRTDSGNVPLSFLKVHSLAVSGTRVLAGTISRMFTSEFQLIDGVRYGNYRPSPDPVPDNIPVGEIPEYKSMARYAGYYKPLSTADAFYIADDPLPGWGSQRRKR